MAMPTLVLERADVSRHLEALHLMQALRDASIARARGAIAEDDPLRVDASSRFPGGGPGSRVLHLHDRQSGALLAVMDADHLLSLRTALVGAIAADVLSRPESNRVAVIGAGPLGRLALKMLRLVRSLEHVRVFDPEPAKAHVFAHDIYTTLSLPIRAEQSAEEAVSDADIVVVTLGGSEPWLFPGMVAPGAHVSAVGGDLHGVHELSPNLIRQSRFFCDDRALLEQVGGNLPAQSVIGELGQVLTGEVPGRTSPDEVTLFSSMGLALHDLATARHVYESAQHDEAIARTDLTH